MARKKPLWATLLLAATICTPLLLSQTPPDAVDRQSNDDAPSLTGVGSLAVKNTLAFIDWASASTVKQQEQAREIIQTGAKNRDVVRTLCDQAFQSRERDHSRALIVLSILGEMRSDMGAECLARFVQLPLPQDGTVVEGEIVEQTALATLQAKAIDGLAYLQTPEGDEHVLRAVAGHPSRVVRAEAINAYLWNHGDSEEARKILSRYVRPDERIFLDRVRREPGETADSFNAKLKIFLEKHPELIPPKPEKSIFDAPREREEKPRPQEPPKADNK